MPAIIADRRLCVTADRSRVVEEDDPTAAFLFAPAGGEVGAADVDRYQLVVEGGRVVLPGAEPAPAAPAGVAPPATEGAPKPAGKGKPKGKG